MRSCLLAFDIDGTLFDTQHAVQRAYECAGAPMDKWQWGRPATEWLLDAEGNFLEDVHRAKNYFYAYEVEKLCPLPAFWLFRRQGGLILTGASQEAAEAILRYWNLNPVILTAGATLKQKISCLQQYPAGIYYDDDDDAARHIEEETRWKVVISPRLW